MLHSSFKLSLLPLEARKSILKDKKAALHTYPTLHYTDIQSIYYFHTNTPLSDTYDTSAHAWYYRKFPQIKANKIIPLGKHYERCEARQRALSQVLSTYGNEPYKLYNDKILPTLYKLEKESINTNDKFDLHFKLKCKKDSNKKYYIAKVICNRKKMLMLNKMLTRFEIEYDL